VQYARGGLSPEAKVDVKHNSNKANARLGHRARQEQIFTTESPGNMQSKHVVIEDSSQLA
jgi:hypothetical protein